MVEMMARNDLILELGFQQAPGTTLPGNQKIGFLPVPGPDRHQAEWPIYLMCEISRG